MKDDGVAPVIAVMLILAVAVTFLAVFNGIYIPSLKQSAEIDHLEGVESSFLKFSSDLTYAATSRQDHLSFAEPVQLGGGNVVFNTLRSGGSLSLRTEETPVYNLTLYGAGGTPIAIMDGTMVDVSYEPQGNFWQDQGYRWQYGYVNVTKYGSRESPLSYDTMDGVTGALRDPNATSLATFARSFAAVDRNLNRTPLQNVTPTPDNRFVFVPQTGTCDALEIRAVSIAASRDHVFTSGNGYGTFSLTSAISRTLYDNVTGISVGAEVAGSDAASAFRNATLYSWNATFFALNATDCKNNIMFAESRDGFYRYDISQTQPVNVSLSIVGIEVSAY
jgi:hypothetical protein